MIINGKDVYAHRIAWCLAHNVDLADIEAYQVIRICAENSCVSVDHLILKPKAPKK